MQTVMIVDDDVHILDVCRLVFERAGYRVNLISRGDALLSGTFEEPDLFIIDRQLQGADGLDICRYLKQRQPPRNTPVIMFSATPRVGSLSAQAGADDFIEKPFKNKALVELARKHLQKQGPEQAGT